MKASQPGSAFLSLELSVGYLFTSGMALEIVKGTSSPQSASEVVFQLPGRIFRYSKALWDMVEIAEVLMTGIGLHCLSFMEE